eukprot:GGOE01036126.1.p2 GENE.GGOE01036126.1~~GGOE01036126.1.p2  ORF type:complete len:193 (-),score=33.12 GGOE01036126.1:125-661(-)
MGKKLHFRLPVSQPVRPTNARKKGNWRRVFYPHFPGSPPRWQSEMPEVLFKGPLSFRELVKKELPRHWIELTLASLQGPTMEAVFRCPLELSKTDINHVMKEFYGIEADSIRTCIFRGRAYTDPDTMLTKKAPDFKRVWAAFEQPVCLSFGTSDPEEESRRKLEEYIESTRVADEDDL